MASRHGYIPLATSGATLGAGLQAEAGARHAADEDESDAEEGEGGSKRKKRLEARMHIGSLKQAAPRPDVVEVWDVTSTDPKLLVWLKVRRLQPHPWALPLPL